MEGCESLAQKVHAHRGLGMSKELHEKASQILAQVLDLPKERALDQIDALCKDDQVLKNEVLDLLAQMTSLEVQPEASDPTQTKGGTTKHLAKKQRTDRSQVIGEWTKRVFSNKRNRFILVVTVFIAFVLGGILVRNSVRRAILKDVEEVKLALLSTNRTTLENWITNEIKRIEAIASTPEVIKSAAKIDSIYRIDQKIDVLVKTEEYARSIRLLQDVNNVANYAGLSLVHSKTPMVLTNSYAFEEPELNSPITGLEIGEYIYEDYQRACHGESLFIPPFNEIEAVRFLPENYLPGVFCAFAAPIRNAAGEIIMVAIGTYSAQRQFTTIMQISNHGESSETYALDRKGRMISRSRFERDLQQTKALNFDTTKSSIYNIYIKDPGVNIMKGHHPEEAIVNLDYTEIVEKLFANLQKKDTSHSASLVVPYNDYRGIRVVGAYSWFGEYDFGIIVEEDAKDALAILTYVDYSFGAFYLIVFTLLFLLYNSNVKIALIGRKMEDFEQLGQYRLLKELGEGGFGKVYLAEHSFLKMNVAIKVLKAEFTNTETLHRFEREVKLTASLSSPNTVRVFDYGTSDKGSFYYVMEYLNGITLSKAIDMEKTFPVGRAIYVLRHICLSLSEAHHKGLIHRDIKPMNIMLCKLGDSYDVAKVLDFGLVKNVDADTQQTQLNRIGGTPMFMSPERLRDPLHVDQRADIYAIGCVGLYMFSGQFVVELISQQMLSGQETIEGQLSQRLIDREDVPIELDGLLKSCVHFSPEKRPKDVQELLAKLDALQTQYPWSRSEAKTWWKSFDVYGNA